MSASKLAIFGGSPVINETFAPYPSIGEDEVRAVEETVRSGCLSGFYGSWSPAFYGGPKVKQFEAEWATRFKTKHAISVNSNTSGLMAAMGAIGIEPGDEVIVPPFSMSATTMAPLFYGGIPVFVDIEPDTFCLDVEKVRSAITSKTKAIFVVNLFGHAAHLKELRKLADSKGIKLIEDNAQGPLASEEGKYAGTIGHIGIFSLNYHKHIHTGEGGMCTTDDDDLAVRLQMIRNHGENIVEPLGIKNISGLVGCNFRMTEMSAAVGLAQLKNIDRHVKIRESLAEHLSNGISGLEGLTAPLVRKDCRHVYYVWAMRYDETVMGVSRELFSKALAAEGFPHGLGYVQPLYMLPVFQQRIAFGKYPFNLSDRRYERGLCPVAETMHAKELVEFEPCAYDLNEKQKDLLVDALRKVHHHRHELKAL